MRAPIGLLIPIAAALSGCVHFVAFGHDIGGPAAATPASARAAAPPASSPTPAPAAATASQAGTAATVAPAAGASSPGAVPTPAPTVNSVSVNLGQAVQGDASTDLKLLGGPLRAAIEDELRSRKLLGDEARPAMGRTIAISIDGFTARTTSNVIMFGQVFEAGTLAGDVTVRDGNGVALQTYHIKANSHINRPAAGATTDTLTPLYKKFADLTVDNLSGAPRKPVDLTNTGMPH